MHPQEPSPLPLVTIQDPWMSDSFLQDFLKRKLPSQLWGSTSEELSRFGALVVSEIEPLGREAESLPPRLVSFDPSGNRVDHIEVSRAWKDLDACSAREGLVAIGYERKQGEWSRVVQFAKLFLFSPSSAIYTCPLAMTDGAARVLELSLEELPAASNDDWRKLALMRLTHRDPKQFWTSGQWMTEKTGGSDVATSTTIASPGKEKNSFELRGTKWFTSATTSQMTLTLAKIQDQPGSPADPKLSLFFIELRDRKERLQNIEILRLKDKLGTKALPTAELELKGTPAQLLSPRGSGVRAIAPLLNITRSYNALYATALMSRCFHIATHYAQHRHAFGKRIGEHPLHAQSLASMEMHRLISFALVFRIAELLGKEETKKATPSETTLLRALTPIVKLFTAKQAIHVASETLECFGGAGYVEDTGLPKLLRDAQVLSIWEGTTNVLSLDFLRALTKEEAHLPLIEEAKRLMRTIESKQAELGMEPYHLLRNAHETLTQKTSNPKTISQLESRQLAMGWMRFLSAQYLLEYCLASDAKIRMPIQARTLELAQAWISHFCEKSLLLRPSL